MIYKRYYVVIMLFVCLFLVVRRFQHSYQFKNVVFRVILNIDKLTLDNKAILICLNLFFQHHNLIILLKSVNSVENHHIILDYLLSGLIFSDCILFARHIKWLSDVDQEQFCLWYAVLWYRSQNKWCSELKYQLFKIK